MSVDGDEHLHPKNGRVGDEGIGDTIMEHLTYYRRPYVYVARDGDQKHRTPLCPELTGQVYRMVCNEEALYAYGERWCDTCRSHDLTVDGTGWTDPRYTEAADE